MDDERIIRVYASPRQAEEAGAWRVGLADFKHEQLGHFFPRASRR
jgi:hypothetical protein